MMYAVVRLRGSVKVNRRIKDTLIMLGLKSVNNCVVVPKTPTYDGMLKKARSYITWGEVGTGTLETLVSKRGRVAGKRLDEKSSKGIAKSILEKGSMKSTGIKVFRLSPPSRGLRGIKSHYPRGDLGYRGEKINELLKRMI